MLVMHDPSEPGVWYDINGKRREEANYVPDKVIQKLQKQIKNKEKKS